MLVVKETEVKAIATYFAGHGWQGDITFEHRKESKERRWGSENLH